MAAALSPPATWQGERVRVAEVAERLRELRGAAGHDLHSTLTSVLNLVAWAPTPEAAAALEDVLDGLADHHPSRVVIVVPAAGPDGIDARVEVMSREQTSGGRTLQVEQVALTLRGAVAAHAASAVVPLLRSELPTFLWWPAAPDPASPVFAGLRRIADRLVTEAARDGADVDGLARLAGAVDDGGAPLTDLAWASLTSWRQMILTATRGEALLRLRVGPARAVVASAGGLEGRLLAGWLTGTIGDHLRVEHVPAHAGGPVSAVDLWSGETCLVGLACDGPSAALLRTAAGGPRMIPLAAPDRRSLLAGELELRGRDRTFEAAVACAARLPAP